MTPIKCKTCTHNFPTPLYRGYCQEARRYFTEGDRVDFFVHGLTPSWCPLPDKEVKK